MNQTDDTLVQRAAHEHPRAEGVQLQRHLVDGAGDDDHRVSRLESGLFGLAQVAGSLETVVGDLMLRLAHVTQPAAQVVEARRDGPNPPSENSPTVTQLDTLIARLDTTAGAIRYLMDRLDV